MLFARQNEKYGAAYPKVQLLSSVAIAAIAVAFIITKWIEWSVFPIWPFLCQLCICLHVFYGAIKLKAWSSETNEDDAEKMIN